MARQVISKSVPDLTSDELAAARPLTLPTGSMWPTMQGLRWRPRRDGRVILVYEDAKLVGWGLLFRSGQGPFTLHMFVHKEWRRRGIGRLILARARMGQRKPIFVCPWNQTSRSFYADVIDSGKVRNAYGY